MIIGSVTLSAIVLHGIEAIVWACAYRLLNALPDIREAILYSLNAITSYGHANLRLENRWELMGALEALNGWLLFGLSTAFLYAVIRLTLFGHSLGDEPDGRPARQSGSATTATRSK